MRRLGRILVTLLAVTGLLTLGLVGVGVWAAVHFAGSGDKGLPDQMVLSLDLEGRFRAQTEADPLAAFSGEHSYELRRVVEALDRGAADPRVKGLFATAGHATLGFADAQDIRDAVLRFKASGKPAVLFAETIGEGGSGTLDTYLASAFGQVWLQPSGEVGLTGIMAESPFLKGAFDLLGIKPQFSGRYEYKSAIEIFTETGYSPAHRENLGRMLDSWADQLVDGIAAGRRLSPDAVRGMIGKGPFLPAEAKAAGLVDLIGYRDEAWAAVIANAAGAEEADLADYAQQMGEGKGVKVALVSGVGAIHRGESHQGFDGADDFGAQTVAEALRDAIDDEGVKAILFRVDSPGGSYTASDTVWHEVKRARAAGKPVVVSMGNVAASGGYFVAMAADRIIAQPGTITGSIGVFSGKIVLEEFWKKVGISWDEMHRGDNAAMWSANRPFSPQAQARLDALLDHIYGDFTGKAQDGRKIGADKMDKLARGRVWTGADAKAAGLVDDLGGWPQALAAVREVAGLKPDEALRLVDFPQPKKPWELLAELLDSGSVSERRKVAGALSALAKLEPFLGRLAALGNVETGQLRMAPDLPDGARP